jgi:peptide/histidine transporter 3/4
MRQFRWLDDRATVATTSDDDNPCRLCTMTQVELERGAAAAGPVWASGIVMAAAYSQMSAMFVLQGNTLDDLRIGGSGGFKIPSASLSMHLRHPQRHRLGGGLRPAHRPHRAVLDGPPARLHPAPAHGHRRGRVRAVHARRRGAGGGQARLGGVARHAGLDDYLPISIFWQLPQYFIHVRRSDLNFFYDEAPDAM